jgi:hypothetical protein
MTASNRDGPEDTVEARVPGSAAKVWLLLDADRRVVAGALLCGIFGVVVVLGAVDPTPLGATIKAKDPIETLFQALLTALITGVTLVLTINQLVLSQELGAVGDQRERMDDAMEFRRDVESVLDTPVGPPDPAGFLRAVVESARSRADALGGTVVSTPMTDPEREVTVFVDNLTCNAEAVSEELSRAQFGTFDVVGAALDFEYSWKIYRARRLKAEYGDELGAETCRALDDVVELLEIFGSTREHVKTLYFQWELIDLSRAVSYAAVPALAVTVCMILYVSAPGTVPGSTLGVENLVWLVATTATGSFLPFALLLSYILRIATVAKRTLAIGPFVLRETDAGADFERRE